MRSVFTDVNKLWQSVGTNKTHARLSKFTMHTGNHVTFAIDGIHVFYSFLSIVIF